jgi:hypothetical protein
MSSLICPTGVTTAFSTGIPLVLFIISEVMPFIPSKYIASSGLVHAIYNFVLAVAKKESCFTITTTITKNDTTTVTTKSIIVENKKITGENRVGASNGHIILTDEI